MENTKKTLIDFSEFADMYDIEVSRLYSLRYNHPTNSIIVKSKNNLYINLTQIERIHRFRKRIWDEAHVHYHLLKLSYSATELASILEDYSSSKKSSWEFFISSRLWETSHYDQDDILNLKVSKQLWVFHRLTYVILKKCFKKLGKPVNEEYFKQVMYEKVG